MAAGLIVAQLIGIAIGSLFTAIILRAAAQWVQKVDVPQGEAYIISLMFNLCNWVVIGILVLAVARGTQSMTATLTASILSIPIAFLVMAGFIRSGLEIEFGRACLISLVMVAISVAIGLLIGIPVVMLT